MNRIRGELSASHFLRHANLPSTHSICAWSNSGRLSARKWHLIIKFNDFFLQRRLYEMCVFVWCNMRAMLWLMVHPFGGEPQVHHHCFSFFSRNTCRRSRVQTAAVVRHWSAWFLLTFWIILFFFSENASYWVYYLPHKSICIGRYLLTSVLLFLFSPWDFFF